VPYRHYLRLSPLQPTIWYDLAMHIDLAKFVIDTDEILHIPTHVSLESIVARYSLQRRPTGFACASESSIDAGLDLVPKALTRDRMQEMTDYHILTMLPYGYTLRDSGYARLMICNYANLLHGRKST
jgi:hypothetical protein